MTKQEWWRIAILFGVWLVFLTMVTFLADFFLPFKPSFPYAENLREYALPGFLTKLAHFDGVHYLQISRFGYLGTGLIQAFFPLYPLLIALLNQLVDNYLLSGLLISHFFTALCFVSFYYLVKMDFGRRVAFTTLLIFALFSSSFFLRSLYGESLFLSIIFLSLISAKKGHYFLAGVLGALASATRVIGVFIWPSLLLLVWLREPRNLKAYLAVSLSGLGLAAYMYYLQITFADPLYFFNLQREFGASRQTNLVLLPQVIYRYLNILWTARPFDLKYYAYLQEFALSIFALGVLLRASWLQLKQKRRSQLLIYLLFAWLAYLLPPLTGNFSSMPRYLLSCFVIFIYLGSYFSRRPRKLILYLTISIILLIINIVLFSQGYWVA